MSRELVKDCEDIEGDKAFGLLTMPIRIGVVKTNIFIGLFLATLLIVCLSWAYWSYPLTSTWVSISILPIVFLNFLLIFKIAKTKTKSDYTNISKLIKVIMGLGIISLSIISYQS